MSIVDRIVRRFVPLAVRVWWRRGGAVNLGDLRSPEPLSRVFGSDRGQPICRWYITRFLAAHAGGIHGRVLEVAGNDYTRRFGGARVTRSDVLMVVEGNPAATIVGDLQTGAGIPEGAFDAIILTQVLQCVFDLPGAMRTIHRALAPGGTVLITAPAVAMNAPLVNAPVAPVITETSGENLVPNLQGLSARDAAPGSPGFVGTDRYSQAFAPVRVIMHVPAFGIEDHRCLPCTHAWRVGVASYC